MKTNSLATKFELIQGKDDFKNELQKVRDYLQALEVRMDAGFKDQLTWTIVLMLGFFIPHHQDAEINLSIPLSFKFLRRRRRAAPEDQNVRISAPGFFTNSNGFPEMEHNCRAEVSGECCIRNREVLSVFTSFSGMVQVISAD